MSEPLSPEQSRNPIEQRMSDEILLHLLIPVSSEIKCAPLREYHHPEEALTITQLSERILATRDGEQDTNFASSYLLSLCKQAVRNDVMYLEPSETTVGEDRYGLTDFGFWMARPMAGHQLAWGYKHCANLRELFGEPLHPREGSVSGLLMFLALLREANDQPVSLESAHLLLGKYAELGSSHRAAFNRLGRSSFTITQRGKLTINPDKQPAIDDLFNMIEKAANYDPDFFAEGHVLLEDVLSDPERARYLTQRSAFSSRKRGVGKQKVSYVNLLGRLPSKLQDTSGSVALSQIGELYPSLDVRQLNRLRRHILGRLVAGSLVEGIEAVKADDDGKEVILYLHEPDTSAAAKNTFDNSERLD